MVDNAGPKDIELEVASFQDEVELEIASLSADETPSKDDEPTMKLEVASLTTQEPKSLTYNRNLVRKAVQKIMDLKKRLNLDTASLKSKIQEEANTKVNWYKTNAVELLKRRETLGKFANGLSDEKIMDDNFYANAKLEKENALLKASKETGNDVVGDKYYLGKDDAEMDRLRTEISNKAFGNS